MPFTIPGFTATVGATEYSLAQNANYSSGAPMTTDGYVQAFVNLSALTAAESYRLRIYERVNGGTQLVAFETVVVGAQSQLFAFPAAPLLIGDGWDVTAMKLAGTDRSLSFSVRQDTNDMNAATLGAAALTSISGLITASIAPIAAAVMASVIETGANITGGTADLTGTLRVLLSKAAGQVGNYLTGTIAYRNIQNTKDRITGTAVPGGTGRTATSIDPT